MVQRLCILDSLIQNVLTSVQKNRLKIKGLHPSKEYDSFDKYHNLIIENIKLLDDLILKMGKEFENIVNIDETKVSKSINDNPNITDDDNTIILKTIKEPIDYKIILNDDNLKHDLLTGKLNDNSITNNIDTNDFITNFNKYIDTIKSNVNKIIVDTSNDIISLKKNICKNCDSFLVGNSLFKDEIYEILGDILLENADVDITYNFHDYKEEKSMIDTLSVLYMYRIHYLRKYIYNIYILIMLYNKYNK